VSLKVFSGRERTFSSETPTSACDPELTFELMDDARLIACGDTPGFALYLGAYAGRTQPSLPNRIPGVTSSLTTGSGGVKESARGLKCSGRAWA